MKYIVFEAGSRAGFSAEMFYRAWKRNHPERNVKLIMGDRDFRVNEVPTVKGVSRKWDSTALAYVGEKRYRLFPADEMMRQKDGYIHDRIADDITAAVNPALYDKAKMNDLLTRLGEGYIKIPKTFSLDEVFIKPNTGSAGSRGLMPLDNVCVSERINIKTEYVIDVLEKDGDFHFFGREVALRSGYDKLIKLLPETYNLIYAVRQLVDKFNSEYAELTLFRGIFHIQIAEDFDGKYFFIEASKRISGTSIVNVFRGFNPFDVLEDTEAVSYPNQFEEGKWYRYEDFLLELHQVL